MIKIYKKVIVIGIISILLFSGLVPGENVKNENILKSSEPETHLIKGVPYIPQTEGYFCYYACLTMIFNYLGLNTSLDEVLFYAGLGYFHSYNQNERLPMQGRYSDFSFIYNLFDIEENWWYADKNLSEDERWEQYYTKLKENINSNTPLITSVDPFSLPSLRNQFKIHDFLWHIIFPSGYHLIVVVGYNDTNQSICYNDPNAGFYGDNSYGNYAWINLSEFRKSHEKMNSYRIDTLKQINQSSTKKDAFEETFRKNIEKLKGNFSKDWIFTDYGINASKIMQKIFSPGVDNNQKTIQLYKKYGGTGVNFTIIDFMHRLCSILFPYKPNIFDIIMVGKKNSFKDIVSEKNHVADYLENCKLYPDLCKNQSIHLRIEAEKWYELSKCYEVFLRRGIHLSNIRANIILYKMEKTINEIIQIEQQIIDEGSHFLNS